ncbi:MAG TPA: hypothetical protein ENI76_07890 [Ignavibacteria bacterium]|nr:hypothetical protein [Ignavibacteria bacterium]
MEIFNSLGASNKFSVINYNNTIYLKNEYGMWLISSTQSEKLDYKLNSIGLTYPNLPATICQINNLNFYLQIINGFSVIKGEYTNMILAYCIDLGQFYYLDFGFNIQGVYATVSETDHSIYAWDDTGNLYKLFEGTDTVSIYLHSKYFDFDFDFVDKTIEKCAISLVMRSGAAQLEVSGRTLSLNGFDEVNRPAQTVSSGGSFTLFSPTYPTAPIAFTNSYGVAIALANPLVTIGAGLYYICIGGTLLSLIIQDTSASVYDISSIFLRGQIGRELI